MLDDVKLAKLKRIYHSPSAVMYFESWAVGQSKDYIINVLIDRVYEKYIEK